MVVYHRRLPKFEYLLPGTLAEALEMLSSYPGNAVVLAGGTDLIPKLRTRKIKPPEYIVDLKNIPDLDYIRYDSANGLSFGALAAIRAFEKSPLIKEKYPILFEAAESMASIQVRNRGTIAGNICNAVPSADSAPALLCLGARVKITSRQGERTVNIEDFFTGPNKTAIADGEILVEIQVPVPSPGSRGCYLKLSPRRSMDLAVVGVASFGAADNGTFRNVSISLGAVAPTPVRAKLAEAVLEEQKISSSIIEKAADQAALESKPIDDHRASAEYRRDMVRVLTRRALEQIYAAEL